MIGDHPNLPEANNQPISQQPLILRNKQVSFLDQLAGMNTQQPLLDQPTDMNAQQPLLDQPTDMNAQQPLLDQPTDMNAQQPLLDQPTDMNAQQPLLDQPTDMNAQQPLLDQPTDMNAQQPLLDQPAGMNIAQLFPDMQHPFPDMQPTFAQQTVLDPEQPFLDVQQPFPDAQQWQQPFAETYQSQFGYTNNGLVHPEYLLHRQPSSSPANPLAKLAHLWRSDPAYRVFFLALATVLISGLVCLAIISNLFKAPSSTSQGPDAHQTTGTSAPTPVNIPTPMPSPTPTPSPTPIIEPITPPSPPAPSQLAVQITNIPSVVMNNTTASVSVTTNQSGVSVSLSVTYSSATPSSFNGGSKTTDSNGQATLPWHVNIHPLKKFSTVTAHVTIFAQDTNGQNATSQTVTVQIITFQGG